MFCGDETGSLIIDLGTTSSHFGYGGLDSPSHTLPSSTVSTGGGGGGYCHPRDTDTRVHRPIFTHPGGENNEFGGGDPVVSDWDHVGSLLREGVSRCVPTEQYSIKAAKEKDGSGKAKAGFGSRAGFRPPLMVVSQDSRMGGVAWGHSSGTGGAEGGGGGGGGGGGDARRRATVRNLLEQIFEGGGHGGQGGGNEEEVDGVDSRTTSTTSTTPSTSLGSDGITDAVYVTPGYALSAFSLGKPTALVVDVGEGELTAE